MSRFLIGITGDLEEECRAVMLHDNMDVLRLIVHIQQVEDIWKKMVVHNVRMPKPSDQKGNSYGVNRKNFDVCEQP